MRSATLRHGLLLSLLVLGLAAPSVPAEEPPAASGEAQTQQLFGEGGGELVLDLKRAIDLALENNEEIALSRLELRQAIAGVNESLGILDPTLTVSTDYRDAKNIQPNTFNVANPIIDETAFNLNMSLSGLLPTGTKYSLSALHQRSTSESGFVLFSPEYNATVSASLTQPLLKGFGLGVTMGGIRIARIERQIETENYENKISERILATIEAYWELAFAIENLKNQQESLEVAKDLVRAAENRVKVKLDPPIALTQAREGAAQREEKVLIARNQLGVAEDTLKKLIGMTRDNVQLNARIRTVEEAPEESAMLLDADSAVKMARSRRPEYEVARLTFEQLDTTHRTAQNATLPQFDVSIEGGLSGLGGKAKTCEADDDLDDSCDQDRENALNALNSQFNGSFGRAYDDILNANAPYWKVSGVLTIPLGNRTARSQLTKAILDEQIATENFKLLDQTVLLEVRSALRSVLTDRQRFRTTEIGVELAKENLNAERKRYEVGLSTGLDVLEQEENHNLARASRARAVSDYNISLARYRKAVGILLDNYGIVAGE
ncbi:MAG: TolC family protein [Bdellovibrionota bacterium]